MDNFKENFVKKEKEKRGNQTHLYTHTLIPSAISCFIIGRMVFGLSVHPMALYTYIEEAELVT